MKKMKVGRMGKQNVYLAFARFGVRSSVLKGARSEREALTLQGTMEIDGNVWNLRRVGQGERLKEGLALQGSFKPTDRRTTSSLQAFKAQFMGSQGRGWPDGSAKGSGGAPKGNWEAIGERKGSFGVLHLKTKIE